MTAIAPASVDTRSEQRAEGASPYIFAAEARNDRWRDLRAFANTWASENNAAPVHKQVVRLFGEIEPAEAYWAYPGPDLMQVLRDMLQSKNAGAFARLVERVGRGMMSGSYRHDPAAWDPFQETAQRSIDALPPDISGEPVDAQRPYFEILVVTPNDPRHWAEGRKQLQRLRRREDPFVYGIVQVGTFEDAAIAAALNHDLQAIVIYDGFSFASRHEAPLLRTVLTQTMKIDPAAYATEGKGLGARLASVIKNFRPQLDIYMLTDRSVESIAGSEDSGAIRRVFFDVEEALEVHLAIMEGVNERYRTPYFSNLVHYSQRPIGTFHALPIARGKSVFHSNWIRDMGQFYGTNIFLAESSATTGGLDSLLEPTGNIKFAQEAAARAFGSKHAFFATNGTTGSIKIVVQAVCAPGDIVVVDRNCHKSHHYAFVLAGVQPVYVEAFPLTEYSMYGSVPLRTIKKALLDLRAEGKLARVKAVDLTNCTFDGHMYNTRRVMEECLAIKPDLVFIWDEAWFGFARFSPLHRRRTAMGAAKALTDKFRSAAYRKTYEAHAGEVAKLDDAKLLDKRLFPDPDKVRIRTYQVNSTHKSMSAFRQGSMMLIWDEMWEHVSGCFQEAFLAHTSTSPNLQLIASIDVARRQMELEGYELTSRMTGLAIELRQRINSHPLISKYFTVATAAQMIPAEFRKTGFKDFDGATWKEIIESWEEDEFALDPTRLTVLCGSAGYDGTQFKGLLASKFDIQLNKTSRNSILIQININNTRGDGAQLIKALATLSKEIEDRLTREGKEGRAAFDARVKMLTVDVPDLPNFRAFHDSFRDNPKGATSEGHMREAFYKAYDEKNCEFVKLASKEIDDRLKKGPALVSANFVIPYPPGFPIMVPGQVITEDIITFMRKLDVKEIHGYEASHGLKLLRPDQLKPAASSSAR